ncbi:MAG TPA: flagellar motor protein [Myxococcota bacterium]
MDFTTPGGLVIAVFFILFGQWLEGGHAGSLVQLTALLIVGGGTLGAIVVANPASVLKGSLKMAGLAMKNVKDDKPELSKMLLEFAVLARKDGVLALEAKMGSITDPFLKRAIGMVVDGVDRNVARDVLESQAHHDQLHDNAAAKVWESAGGFAPTVGILGAVLGLIHVMENLSDPSKLGGGIATAFVATVYGVGMSNLIFLPLAQKAKMKVAAQKDRKTLIIEAVLGIQEGMSTNALSEKIVAYGGVVEGKGGGH